MTDGGINTEMDSEGSLSEKQKEANSKAGHGMLGTGCGQHGPELMDQERPCVGSIFAVGNYSPVLIVLAMVIGGSAFRSSSAFKCRRPTWLAVNC